MGPFRELALQVSGLVLVDDPTLGQLVDLGNNVWQLLIIRLFIGAGFQLADGVTGCFAIVTVTIAAFGSLSYIFLGSCVVCHVLFFSGRQR